MAILSFGERPDGVPLGSWFGGGEVIDAAEEYLAWAIAGGNREAAFETASDLVPGLTAVGVDGGIIGVFWRPRSWRPL